LGDIAWQVISNNRTTLLEAKKLFQERLLPRTGLPKELINELALYRAEFQESTRYGEAEEQSTEVPDTWIRFSTEAREFINAMYEAFEAIATGTCACSSSPEYHHYEMRLPLLAFQLPREALRLQMRMQDGDWQHAWIIRTQMYVT
jgi:hypothetical protein